MFISQVVQRKRDADSKERSGTFFHFEQDETDPTVIHALCETTQRQKKDIFVIIFSRSEGRKIKSQHHQAASVGSSNKTPNP